MTWSGVEFNEFMPSSPTVAVGVSDRWVVARSTTGSGAYSGGTYSVFDTMSLTSRSFSGLNGFAQRDAITEWGGQAWTVGFTILQSIDPASGTFTNRATISSLSAIVDVVAADSYILSSGGTGAHAFWPGSSTLVSWSEPSWGAAPVTVGDRLFTASSAGIREWNPTTGAILNTWPLPSGTNVNLVRPTKIGSRIYWRSSAAGNPPIWFDPTTGASGTVTPTPTGYPGVFAGMQSFVAAAGGLYAPVSQQEMSVIDPNSGRWALRSFPTVRTDRRELVAVAGALWVTYG